MRQTLRHTIAYLWAPYFGAGVAHRAEPELAARPLALLDDQGCVLAADAPAIRAGICCGLTERQAAARCPAAALLPAGRFPLREAQERFLNQVKGYTDRWQPDGLGQVYLQAPFVGQEGRAEELLGWLQAVAADVRGLGWQSALGATGSKFGASIAGQAAWHTAKQCAALLLAPAAQRDFLAGQPVATLPLDADVLLQLRHLGIRTLGQYAHLPAAGVLARFGQAGRTAQRWAQGLDDRPIVPPWEAPEVSARIEFDSPVSDSVRLLAVLTHQADRLLNPLRERLQAVTRLSIAVTRADGRTLLISHILPQPTAAAEPVRLALASLLARLTWDGEGAIEVVLTVGCITDAPACQLTLFDPEDDGRARLSALLDRLAARFGTDAFRLASLTDPDSLLLERRAAYGPWR